MIDWFLYAYDKPRKGHVFQKAYKNTNLLANYGTFAAKNWFYRVLLALPILFLSLYS